MDAKADSRRLLPKNKGDGTTSRVVQNEQEIQPPNRRENSQKGRKTNMSANTSTSPKARSSSQGRLPKSAKEQN
ncbi:hypothetical protein M9H77_29911 [Catharanthus roseus]|uniref:Uncharacterized protein n=1 Tax=Catharanthus roseus TaxID=4058 RepID=A0ACB9ZXQ4_CATRO|nr:hypothetical protein M9H77_29911 [Catharanthus roseus]